MTEPPRGPRKLCMIKNVNSAQTFHRFKAMLLKILGDFVAVAFFKKKKTHNDKLIVKYIW